MHFVMEDASDTLHCRTRREKMINIFTMTTAGYTPRVDSGEDFVKGPDGTPTGLGPDHGGTEMLVECLDCAGPCLSILPAGDIPSSQGTREYHLHRPIRPPFLKGGPIPTRLVVLVCGDEVTHTNQAPSKNTKPSWQVGKLGPGLSGNVPHGQASFLDGMDDCLPSNRMKPSLGLVSRPEKGRSRAVDLFDDSTGNGIVA
ncbi:hypothetical protein MRB53_010688 [Persea americana]|uniref:Uncharacterized protein n=1 Tax=Persea americana TaxID=3435 RepID=A0ACC2LSS3_PERAE|nr:hypothetical protein MRB53_010688 [Persea americana]